MTKQEFIQEMTKLGYSREGAEDTIWVAPDENDLTQTEFNFVPAGGGLYKIMLPSDRGGFFPARDIDRNEFLGTLEEAYEYVFQKKASWSSRNT